MLAVIDYGAGNLHSVLHALQHIGASDIQIVRYPEQLHGAKKIILPGVGAFGAGIQALKKQKLIEPLQKAIAEGIPYLGICLGMQFLFEQSDEMGEHKGLGILEGYVTRFSEMKGYKIPHMGWNRLNLVRQSPLLHHLPDDSYAYFVHSYYCVPQRADDTLISVNYGINFTAAVHRDNIYGVQFHPEKSQRTGLQILANFIRLSVGVAQ